MAPRILSILTAAGAGVAVAVLCLLVPAPGAAQDLGTQCTLDSYRVLSSQAGIQGLRVTRVGRPILSCPDGTRIAADSAVIYEESGLNEFIGQVRFRDPLRELDSDRADYFEREGRLHARGSVEFRDLVQGTEMRGDTLVFLEAGALRAEDQVTVQGSRPSVTFLPADAPEEDEDGVLLEPEPYHVVANRLRFEGDRYFWADGDAELDRDDLRASADSLWFHREGGDLALTGRARLITEDTEFSGDRILLELPGDEIRSITVVGDGRLTTVDLELFGDEIRIRFENERIQRLVAVRAGAGEEDEEDQPGRPRPRAVAEDFFLQADSIEVLSPDERLETVHAVGRARGEMNIQDDADTDTAGENGVPDRDWIEGDAILATFEPVPAPPNKVPEEVNGEGEARPEYRLEQLVATGSARTLYRTPPEDGVNAEGGADRADLRNWSMSYLLADEIEIHLLDGAVDRVEAEGTVRGLQLEPSGTRTSSDDGIVGGQEDLDE